MLNRKQNNVILILLTVLFFGCTQNNAEIDLLQSQETGKTTFVLKSEKFQPTLKLSGTLEPLNSSNIAPKAAGRVKNLYVDVGDSVFVGDLLAELAEDESGVGLQTSQTNENSLKEIYKTQEELLNKQIQTATRALETAETTLKNAKTSSADLKDLSGEQILLGEQTLQQAQTSLENVQKIAERRLATLYDSVDTNIVNALILTENANTFVEDFLNVDEAKGNDDISNMYEKFLGTKDLQLKVQNETSLKKSFKLYDAFYTAYLETRNSAVVMSRSEQKKSIENMLKVVQSVKETTALFYQVLDSTSTSSKLPQTILDEFKVGATQYTQNLEALILSTEDGEKIGLKGWLLNLEEIETQNQAEISSVKEQVLVAEQNLSQIKSNSKYNITGSDGSIDVLERQVAQAKVALEAVISQKEISLQNLQLKIDLAENQTRISEYGVINTKVYAPYSGIITNKYVEVGQVIAVGQPVFQVARNDELKVSIYAPDTVLNKLSKGLNAQIVFENFSENSNGFISKIDPNVNLTSRKLGLEVSLDLKPTFAKIGQFVDVEIFLPIEKQAFFVPYAFVQVDFEGAYVNLEDGSKQRIVRGVEKDGTVKIWWEGIREGIVIQN